jgi:NAD(P)-dependent dehydrogenase (short-subunit alcohol dehydrogenase family)
VTAGVLDTFRLDGRVAIVTGASSGLGVAFARALAEAGADVAEPGDCRNLVRETVEQLGRVDVLVNNAGVGTAVTARRETPKQFEQVIAVNLNGAY